MRHDMAQALPAYDHSVPPGPERSSKGDAGNRRGTQLVVLAPCSLFPILVPAFATHRVLQSQRLDRPGRLSIIAEGPAAGKAQVPARLLLLARHRGCRKSEGIEGTTYGAVS